MDATLADSLAGHLLDGRYRVESRIARGGMATVYIATDTRLERTVALKIMHKELASDHEFIGRFIDEAKSVARLSHPNVVAVFDQGSDRENLYLAMEYIAGRTLRDLLNERGRLAPEEALDLMVQILAGLGAAHQAGLVHRDVKPENVLLTPDRRVKVVDFGLARAVAHARHTRTGMLIGTAAYLAPEQVSRATADARSDVYAAGIMLFELVTGRQPYTGDTPLAVAYRHVNETVPAPSRVLSGVPHSVDAVVALATSREPELRPGDASRLLGAVLDARRRLPGGSAFAPGPEVPRAGFHELPGQPGRRGAAAQSQPGRQDGPAGGGAAPYGLDAPPAGMPGPVPGGPPGQVPGGPPGQLPGGPPGQLPPGGLRPQQSATFGVPGVPGVSALPAFAASNGGTSGFDSGMQAGGQNNTLVVSRGHPGPGGQQRRPALGDWLFSRRAAYLAGALAVVVAISVLVWWQVAGRYTRVPNVAGLPAATASAELRNAGFTVKMDAPQIDNQVPKGDVARTIPAIGSHAPNGATITVIPSAGPRMIVVPDVTGRALADAQKALTEAGLTPGTVQQETSPTVPKGEVISTDPAAGTSWPQPQPVKITESAGVGLPDFTGQPKQVAEHWLQQYQLQVQEQPATSSTQPPDTVVKQSPAANTPITPGEVVTLYISAGPQMVQIPSVTGMSVHDARKQLESLGFTVSVVGFPDGDVIAYSPTGQAPKGSTITLVAGPSGGQP